MNLLHHIKQGGWATLEYLAYPILMFASTPYFLRELGPINYGQWMLLVAMSGIGGLAGFGMGAATTKEISNLRGGENKLSSGQIIRNSLAVALTGNASIGMLFLIVWLFLPTEWIINLGSPREIIILLSFSFLIICFEQIDAVYTGTIKGFERFDLAARIEIFAKLVNVMLCIACVAYSSNLQVLFSVIVFATVLRTALKAYVASKLAQAAVFFPQWNRLLVRQLFRFGKWTWVQSIGASLFAVADRLVIGSLLGSEALARYAVLTQLAQQVHTIPSAASAIIFPMVSRKVARSEPIGRTIAWAFACVAALVGAIAVPLFFFGNSVIVLWVGNALPSVEKNTLPFLVLAFFVLAMNIVPHYILLGLNRPRLVATGNIIAGLASLACCIWTIPAFGLLGGAYAKMVFGAIITFVLFGALFLNRTKRLYVPQA